MERTRTVIEEGDGRGRKPGDEPKRRALCLVEQLHRNKQITYEEFVACGNLRNLHLMLQPASEGVSSYGQSPGGANPSRKADRKAKRMTGIEIGVDGEIRRGESRANRSLRWKYEDALFAMCGCVTEEGEKVISVEDRDLILKACIETENPPTQSMIGRVVSMVKSEKQQTASATQWIREKLKRLALHQGLIKGKVMKGGMR